MNKFWRKILVDLAFIPVLFVGVYIISSKLNLFDHFYLWARKYESTSDIDEIGLPLFSVLVALVWFGIKRIEEARVLIKRNQYLLGKVISVQEEERKRIARDLHDDLSQYISLVKTHASILLSEDLSKAEAQSISTKIIASADHIYSSAKDLIYSLRPVALDELGLADALQHLVDSYLKSDWLNVDTGAKTKIHLTIHDDIDQLSEDVSLSIYRIVQEAINNVFKHSNAQNAYLSFSNLLGVLTIRIIDDGIGFQPSKRGKGLGLVGIAERIEIMNGITNIKSEVGKGTEIFIQIRHKAK
jgi:signal transduction histidine kinase